MPAGIKHDASNIVKWHKAKEAARKQKGKLQGDDYALVMHIYKKMGGQFRNRKKKLKKAETDRNPFTPKYRKPWVVYVVNKRSKVWDVIQYFDTHEDAMAQKEGLKKLYGKYIEVGVLENTPKNRLMVATMAGRKQAQAYKEVVNPNNNNRGAQT